MVIHKFDKQMNRLGGIDASRLLLILSSNGQIVVVSPHDDAQHDNDDNNNHFAMYRLFDSMASFQDANIV